MLIEQADSDFMLRSCYLNEMTSVQANQPQALCSSDKQIRISCVLASCRIKGARYGFMSNKLFASLDEPRCQLVISRAVS